MFIGTSIFHGSHQVSTHIHSSRQKRVIQERTTSSIKNNRLIEIDMTYWVIREPVSVDPRLTAHFVTNTPSKHEILEVGAVKSFVNQERL
jgi:hypothetical protein